jgi:hypothetical protein
MALKADHPCSDHPRAARAGAHHHHRHRATASTADPRSDDTIEPTASTRVRPVLGVLRISLVWIFLRAFVDKLFALGIGMRLATVAGIATLVMMWSAALPPANNPFMDDHLVHALTLGVLLGVGAVHHLGLGDAWNRLAIVRHHRWLR